MNAEQQSPELDDAPVLSLPVHHFAWCRCSDDRFAAEHVRIQTFERPVQSGQAVAVSYGIGDFDRLPRSFGHNDALQKQPVELVFGGEWDIHGLMEAFVALSDNHGAIWCTSFLIRFLQELQELSSLSWAYVSRMPLLSGCYSSNFS
jgi:hypothetical protein